MSMLRAEIDELREAAEKFEGYQCGEISRMLREASDTIESLRDRLQEEGDALRDYRASQIAAEAERRLQELQCVGGESNYTRLFGTPERAMRTIALIGHRYPCDEGCDPSGEKCKVCPFADAPSCRIKRDHPEESPLLEWLKGKSDG